MSDGPFRLTITSYHKDSLELLAALEGVIRSRDELFTALEAIVRQRLANVAGYQDPADAAEATRLTANAQSALKKARGEP